VEATQEIGLYIGNDIFSGASETVTLSESGTSGDQTEVTLAWTPDADDAGERTLTVKSEQDEDSVGIVVNDGSNRPDFLVNVQATDPTVQAGEELTLNVTVENDGDTASEQTVYLFDTNSEAIVDFNEVQLDAGSTTTTQLSWQTQAGDDDTTLRAQTSADEDAVDVSVTARNTDQADFEVTIDEPDEITVPAGETALLNVTVENTGDASDTQGINLFDDDSLLDTTEISLDPGDATTLALGWETSSRDAGTTTELDVRSSQDEESVTVTVEENTADSEFVVDVYESEIPDTIQVGQQLEVNASVSNEGTERDSQDIVLEGDNPLDVQRETLEEGAETNVTLTWTPGEPEENKDLTVRSNDDEESFSIDVSRGSDAYTVEIVGDPSYTSPVSAGETVTVGVEVTTNRSLAATDEPVWLTVTQDGETVAESYRQVDIGSDETKTVTLTWDTDPADVGEYEFSVSTNDEQRTGNELELGPPDLFDVRVESVNTPITAGDKLEAVVTVGNQGDVERSPLIELSYEQNNLVVDVMSIDALSSDDEKTITLTWSTLPGVGDDDDRQDITARLANFPAQETVAVQIDEADSNLDRQSRPARENPLNIDLSEIEIGT